MHTFINYTKTQKIKIEKIIASILLQKIDDVTIFNREQRQIFDRMINHCFVLDKT